MRGDVRDDDRHARRHRLQHGIGMPLARRDAHDHAGPLEPRTDIRHKAREHDASVHPRTGGPRLQASKQRPLAEERAFRARPRRKDLRQGVEQRVEILLRTEAADIQHELVLAGDARVVKGIRRFDLRRGYPIRDDLDARGVDAVRAPILRASRRIGHEAIGAAAGGDAHAIQRRWRIGERRTPLGHDPRNAQKSCRAAGDDVHVDEPGLHDVGPEPPHERNRSRQEPRVVLGRRSEVVKRAAASLETLQVHAPVNGSHMHVVPAPRQRRRDRRGLPFGASSGQGQDHIQESHALTP